MAVVRMPYREGEGFNRKPLFKALVKFPGSPIMKGNHANQFVIIYMLPALNKLSKFVL